MSQKAIYPGTFDPITKGHIDLVERACKLFDKVVLAIAASEAKSPLFNLEERIDISKRIFKGNDQVEIIGFSGLLVDCQFLLESAPRHLHDDPKLAQHHAAGQHFVCDFLDNDARDGGRRF